MPNNLRLPPLPASARLKNFLAEQYAEDPMGRKFDLGHPAATGVGNFIKSFFAPIDAQGNPNYNVAGPVMTGITGARNAAKIDADIIANAPLAATNPAIYGIEFIRRKYPTLSKFINEWHVSSRLNPLKTKPTGGFDPKTSNAIVRYNENSELPEIAGVVGHEVLHGWQKTIRKRLKEMLTPEEGGTYIKYKHDPKLSYEENMANYWKYRSQPIEEEAFQAQDTARQAFHNYQFQKLMKKLGMIPTNEK